MLVAKSLRYGGIYVDAKKCDHESYIRLGLLCPVCSSPIFYVGSQNRKPHTRKLKESIVQVKASSVEAFFSHFEADEDSLFCEARTNPSRANPTREQIIEGERSFQKQSLKMFRGHFLSMLLTSELMVGYEQDIAFYINSLARECGKPIEVINSALSEVETKFLKFFRNNLDIVKNLIIKGYKETETSLLIDDDMKVKIAMEALQFLSTPIAKKILLLLFRKACSEEIQQIAYAYDKAKKTNPNINYEDIRCQVDVNAGEEKYFKYLNQHSTYESIVKSHYSQKSESWQKTYFFAMSYISCILLSVKWGKQFSEYSDWSNEYMKKLELLDQSILPEKVDVPMHKRALGVYHHTIITGHTMYQPISLLTDATRNKLIQLIGELKQDTTKVFDVPVDGNYQTKVIRKKNSILFEVYQGKVNAITLNIPSIFVVAGLIIWDEKINPKEEIKQYGKFAIKVFEFNFNCNSTFDRKVPALLIAGSNVRPLQEKWLASYEYLLALVLLQLFN